MLDNSLFIKTNDCASTESELTEIQIFQKCIVDFDERM